MEHARHWDVCRRGLDEVFLTINGTRRYLVDAGAQCLGLVLQPRMRRGAECGGERDQQHYQHRGEQHKCGLVAVDSAHQAVAAQGPSRHPPDRCGRRCRFVGAHHPPPAGFRFVSLDCAAELEAVHSRAVFVGGPQTRGVDRVAVIAAVVSVRAVGGVRGAVDRGSVRVDDGGAQVRRGQDPGVDVVRCGVPDPAPCGVCCVRGRRRCRGGRVRCRGNRALDSGRAGRGGSR